MFALTDGIVEFRKRKNNKSYVSVIPPVVEEKIAEPAPTKKAKKEVSEPVNEEVVAEATTEKAAVEETVEEVKEEKE